VEGTKTKRRRKEGHRGRGTRDGSGKRNPKRNETRDAHPKWGIGGEGEEGRRKKEREKSEGGKEGARRSLTPAPGKVRAVFSRLVERGRHPHPATNPVTFTITTTSYTSVASWTPSKRWTLKPGQDAKPFHVRHTRRLYPTIRPGPQPVRRRSCSKKRRRTSSTAVPADPAYPACPERAPYVGSSLGHRLTGRQTGGASAKTRGPWRKPRRTSSTEPPGARRASALT